METHHVNGLWLVFLAEMACFRRLGIGDMVLFVPLS